MKTLIEKLRPYLPDFLYQILVRFVGPMPLFFKVIFWVSLAIAMISTAHGQLVEFGIPVPEWLGKANSVAAWVAAIIAKFTVDWEKWEKSDPLSELKKKP